MDLGSQFKGELKARKTGRLKPQKFSKQKVQIPVLKGQVGWGPEQFNQADGIPAYSRGLELKYDLWKSFQTKFYGSTIIIYIGWVLPC